MHCHMYDVANGALVEALSGGRPPCTFNGVFSECFGGCVLYYWCHAAGAAYGEKLETKSHSNIAVSVTANNCLYLELL